MTTVNSGPFGGNGGSEFTDTHDVNSWGRITQISVRHGSRVDSIATTYANGQFLVHGGTGGDLTVITLNDDEFVNKIDIRSGSELDQITFHTSKGVTYGPYGGSGGDPRTVDFGNDVLQYFFGRSGARIDALGFAYGTKPPVTPASVTRSSQVGGDGGSPFDDLAVSGYLVGKIKQIKVRSGGRVDRIETTYDGIQGSPVTYAHGGDGGDDHPPFVLNDNEYITQISGRSGSRLDQIKFTLNSGRESISYGGDGGSPFTLKLDGSVVKALYGRSGSEVDALGVYFAEAIPERIEIQSLVFDTPNFIISESAPISLTTIKLTNNQSQPQTISSTQTITYINTDTTTISITNEASVAFKTETNFLVSKNDLTVGYKLGVTYASQSTETTQTSTAFTFSATVPGNSSIVASCIAAQDKFDVPWTATALVYYQNQSQPERVTNLQGTLSGVQVTNLTAIYN
ncbi:jacalin-like lectin [Undibacterium sp. Ji67W]|uniref:jacalin-like lectin n=1 Tax=Undibacterium sp. Ji67W TaxID=3413042 RepID=UPI003BF201AA